jgi:hypothetical protein
MISDEEAMIIGKLVLERKALDQTGAAIGEEVRRIGNQLKTLGELLGYNSGYYPTRDEPLILTTEHIEVLNAETITRLLKDLQSTGKRYIEVEQVLKRQELIDSMPRPGKSVFKLGHYRISDSRLNGY